VKFPYRLNYEWELPNELDREFDRSFKNILKGSPAVVTCRSPWVRMDLADMPGIFVDAPVIGVNLSFLSIPARYCVSGGDPLFWRHVNPSEHPRVNFILAGSERNLDAMVAQDWPNAWAFTPGGILPRGFEKHQRNFPRPWKYDNSGNVAVWLAWYMGADPIFIAGAHHQLCQSTIHGDDPTLDPTGEALLQHYRGSLPAAREELQNLVVAMRADGRLVQWPGENHA